MRYLLCALAAAGLMLSTFTATTDAATVHKKKSTAKSGARKRTASAPHSGSASRSAGSGIAKPPAARTATSRRSTGKKRPSTTWRNRQLAPTPDRYKEIQQALVTK